MTCFPERNLWKTLIWSGPFSCWTSHQPAVGPGRVYPGSSRPLTNSVFEGAQRPTQWAANIRDPTYRSCHVESRLVGSSCNLGATIPLRLLDRLCRRPNCFVCHENLLQDVWHGSRKSQSTVRSTIRRLKSRLRNAGMEDLACRIRCEGGRYAFMLEAMHDQNAQELHGNAP